MSVAVRSSLLSLESARELAVERARRLPSEEVDLAAALGRTLAADVVSDVALPAAAVSAMDGFAVRAADTASAPSRLALVGESRAGRPAASGLAAGDAMRISTGAVMPAGADAVVRVEDARDCGDAVEVGVRVESGHDVRPAGDAIAIGARVLRAGTVVGPAELGALAAIGRATVACTRKPRVALLTTGDELVEVGQPLAPGQLWDSNVHAVSALVLRAGAEVVATARVGDELEATQAAIAGLLPQADLAIACGGVSVGEHDHVRGALAELGVEELFWRVALRPGKPTWLGASTSFEALVLGLPGNPVSAMVCFQLLALPAIKALLGQPPQPRLATGVLAVDYAKRPGLVHAVRCRLEWGEDGLRAIPTGPQGSHVLTSMVGAEALALLEEQRGDVAAGELVELELL